MKKMMSCLGLKNRQDNCVAGKERGWNGVTRHEEDMVMIMAVVLE